MNDAAKPEASHGLQCPTCDYDLTGLPTERCPECGDRFNLEELRAIKPVKPISVLKVFLMLPAVPLLSAAVLVLCMNGTDMSAVWLVWIGALIWMCWNAGWAAYSFLTWCLNRTRSRRRKVFYVPAITILLLLFGLTQAVLFVTALRLAYLLGWLPNPGGWS